VTAWPVSADELADVQRSLADANPSPWRPDHYALIGGCFVCSPRAKRGHGATGDPLWAAATAAHETALIQGSAGAPYRAGLLALREGPALEAAVRALERTPDALLVDGTGRDHPRRAGLALQLGSVLDVPTVGVTHRPLLADGAWPEDEPGARSPLVLEGALVGYWLRTRPGVRPLAVHAAWRTDPEAGVEIVLSSLAGYRSPEPLRRARRAAREARAGHLGSFPLGGEMAQQDPTSILDEAGVEYELLQHPRTETAAAEAEALGLNLKEVAKTLVLSAPEGYVRTVLPASERLDLRKVREYVEGGKRIHLASEEDLQRDYPTFDLGAVPPFGGAADRVLVDSGLAEQEAVVLEAGSHEQSVRIQTADLLKLAQAEVVDLVQEYGTHE
jgi:deoxyribonuclease V